jgi:hypothetical protein
MANHVTKPAFAGFFFCAAHNHFLQSLEINDLAFWRRFSVLFYDGSLWFWGVCYAVVLENRVFFYASWHKNSAEARGPRVCGRFAWCFGSLLFL